MCCAVKTELAMMMSPLRHHRIVIKLERAAARIGAVIGGHESDARPPRRAIGDPGRGARAGMDQCHALPPEDFGELSLIERHRQGILGLGRKRQPKAAFGLQFRNEPPAGAGDEGPRAALGERRSNVDDLLGPVGAEHGHDLQDRLPGQRMLAGLRPDGSALALPGHARTGRSCEGRPNCSGRRTFISKRPRFPLDRVICENRFALFGPMLYADDSCREDRGAAMQSQLTTSPAELRPQFLSVGAPPRRGASPS